MFCAELYFPTLERSGADWRAGGFEVDGAIVYQAALNTPSRVSHSTSISRILNAVLPQGMHNVQFEEARSRQCKDQTRRDIKLRIPLGSHLEDLRHGHEYRAKQSHDGSIR